MLNTRNNFDAFTPGMKAKLDPTYRRHEQMNEPAHMFKNAHVNIKYRASLLPFTTTNKVNRIIDRMV